VLNVGVACGHSKVDVVYHSVGMSVSTVSDDMIGRHSPSECPLVHLFIINVIILIINKYTFINVTILVTVSS